MKDYMVTVCDQCNTASCWHGVFMCQKSNMAGTKKMRASLLRKLGLEHPSNYNRTKLREIYGGVEDIEEPAK